MHRRSGLRAHVNKLCPKGNCGGKQEEGCEKNEGVIFFHGWDVGCEGSKRIDLTALPEVCFLTVNGKRDCRILFAKKVKLKGGTNHAGDCKMRFLFSAI